MGRLVVSWCITAAVLLAVPLAGFSQRITVNGKPAQLIVRAAGKHSLRITLKPDSYLPDASGNPALAPMQNAVAIRLFTCTKPTRKTLNGFTIWVRPHPLRVSITTVDGQPVQELSFLPDGRLQFRLDDQPVLGMGEGGPRPDAGVNWRNEAVQFDRRGVYDSMQPRWQSGAYGSRNPVPMLVGTKGWAIFVVAPWVQVDVRSKDLGYFIPYHPAKTPGVQNQQNQQQNNGKGLPPVESIVPGLFDLFVFDAHDPAALMKDWSLITGPAAMPPKWALGYMQSHRTLASDTQLLGIVDTFRQKKIPIDAVIYLSTGFTPRGWNKPQPSFEFNPAVFHSDPSRFISAMHNRHVKVILHMVPWDRDKLPTLRGTIPASPGEADGAGQISKYWQQHVALVKSGVDGFWPDEGDWFNLYERLKRHQLYYQGSLLTTPDTRPWSLHRNGYPGIARWGGWVWSGDTESSWKTLEAQIAVGIDYSLSIGPYWGSDIGGFYSNHELTGELYARWFQFAAFCGSFRAHGRTWHTRLPWGWGSDSTGPVEDNEPPLLSSLRDSSIEPIVRKYDELRYQLLPYTYTLAWEAWHDGMPLQRAMWLQYPGDKHAAGLGNQYMWGRDLLVAPVYEKGATSRSVYLPAGEWYDWWTAHKISGGRTIERSVDKGTMPLYVRAGAILPIDPVRQYTAEKVTGLTTIRIFSGTDGRYVLYEDDGISQSYRKGAGTRTLFTWNEKSRQLRITPLSITGQKGRPEKKRYQLEIAGSGLRQKVLYSGKPVRVNF